MTPGGTAQRRPLNLYKPAAQWRLETSEILLPDSGILSLLSSLFPVFPIFALSCFFFFLAFLSLPAVISRVQLDFPFLYPGQYSLKKQTEQDSLRHVYRVCWRISKAKSDWGPETLGQAGFALSLGEKAGLLLQLACAWFSNNGVLSNWCFLYINGNRSTRHRDKATCQQLSISEGSNPSFQGLCGNI